MVGNGERAPPVDPDDLEDAVAAQKPLVGGGDGGLAGLYDAPVDGGQVTGRNRCAGLVHHAVTIAPATARAVFASTAAGTFPAKGGFMYIGAGAVALILLIVLLIILL